MDNSRIVLEPLQSGRGRAARADMIELNVAKAIHIATEGPNALAIYTVRFTKQLEVRTRDWLQDFHTYCLANKLAGDAPPSLMEVLAVIEASVPPEFNFLILSRAQTDALIRSIAAYWRALSTEIQVTTPTMIVNFTLAVLALLRDGHVYQGITFFPKVLYLANLFPDNQVKNIAEVRCKEVNTMRRFIISEIGKDKVANVDAVFTLLT